MAPERKRLSDCLAFAVSLFRAYCLEPLSKIGIDAGLNQAVFHYAQNVRHFIRFVQGFSCLA